MRFHPDAQIFGEHMKFDAARVFRMARSKAYLFGGVEIRWSCEPGVLPEGSEVPDRATFHFPGGLKDYLQATMGKEFTVTREIFAGKTEKASGHGSMEWAITWYGGDPQVHSYCNTIPTPEGGTHEAGLRIALTKGLKAYAELTQNKRAAQITTDDVMISPSACCRSSSASRNSSARPRTSWRPSRPSASSRMRCVIRSTIISPIIRTKRPSCSTG